MTDNTVPPDEWALVEIMGHRQHAGRITEVDRFGTRLLRVDVPAGDGFVTKLYAGSSIFAVHPCDEAVARAQAARMPDPRPVATAAFQPSLSQQDIEVDDEPF